MADWINVVASDCFVNAAGEPLASGELLINAVDGNGNAIPFKTGNNKQSTVSIVKRSIVNGSLSTSLQLANPATTNPSAIGYNFCVKDNSSNNGTIYEKVNIAPNDGDNFNFSKLNTGNYVKSVPVTFVVGPEGPRGIATVVTENGADGNFDVVGTLTASRIEVNGEVSEVNGTAPVQVTTTNTDSTGGARRGGVSTMQTSTPGTHNYAWLFKNVDNSDDSAYTHNVGIESLLINPNTVAGGNGTDAYCIVAGFQLGAGIRDGYGVRIEGGLSNSDAPGQIRNGYGTTHGSVINGLNLGAQCAEGSGNSQNIIMSGMKNGVAKDFQIQVDQDGNGYFETPDGSGALYMGGQVEAQHGIVLPPNGAVSQTLYLQNGTHQSTIGEDSNGNLAVTPGGYGAVQMFPGISGFGGLVLKASQPGVSTSRSVPLYLEYSNAYAAAKIDADGSGNVIVTPANGKALIAPLFQGSLATPSNSSAPGTPGQFMDDANYHYVCVALNTWKRVALESF